MTPVPKPKKPVRGMDEAIMKIAPYLSYCRRTGELTWLERPPHLFADTGHGGQIAAAKCWNSNWAGKVAGTKIKTGYLQFAALGRCMLAHRVAFFIHNGWLPDFIDHENGDRSDNRPKNLRAASPKINARNRRTPKNNKSGEQGVVPHKGAWQVRLGTRYIGRFPTFEAAVDARRAVLAADPTYHANHGR